MIQFCTQLVDVIANPDFWKAAAIPVSCVVGIASLVFVIVNVRIAQKAHRAKIFIDVLTILEGKDNEIRNMRIALNEKIRLFPNYDAGSSEIKEDIDKFHALARSYDKIGLLVKNGAIPINFLFQFYSSPILLAWEHTKGMLIKERKARKQEGHMQLFEILATGAALYRNQQFGSDIPPELIKHIKNWKSWDKWND